ncbi:hypothetical protein J1N35_041084 [Gossypium stocksii]|uniref:DUF4283 domain-containing protein n=1 Tax=Gossypium stocksii TaxID=47602 RepID=A0A9D3ZIW4_9ROSI|nr:hypothetical protein J1N35_041084 [Gossypium stocksii]
MKSTSANLWHPVKRVQILDLGEKRFLFKFFHKMDMDWVVNRKPWTFNNHIFVFHRLQEGEDSVNVPLRFFTFWVQVYDLSMGLFLESTAKQLGNFVGEFLEYDSKSLSTGLRSFIWIRVLLDVRRPLKRRKMIMCMSGINLDEDVRDTFDMVKNTLELDAYDLLSKCFRFEAWWVLRSLLRKR